MVRKNKIQTKWRNKQKKIGKNRLREKCTILKNKIQQEISLEQQVIFNHHQNVQENESNQVQRDEYLQQIKQQQPSIIEKGENRQSQSNDEENKNKEAKSIILINRDESWMKIINRLNSHQLLYREQQLSKIEQFVLSPTQHILYISGVTGTGKTTAVQNTIQKLHLKNQFKLFNCLNQSESHILAELEQILSQFPLQMLIVVFDEVDYLNNIRMRNSKAKIILICNNNCLATIKVPQIISTHYFLPYSQEKAIQIMQKKLHDLFYLIPKNILVQGAKKMAIKGGDFRQIHKYILNWLQFSSKQTHQNRTNLSEQFADPVFFLLQKHLMNSSQKKLSMLSQILQLSQKKQQQMRRIKALKNSCKCNASVLEQIVGRMSRYMNKNECLQFIRLWQEVKILNFTSIKCIPHNMVFDNVIFNPRIYKNKITVSKLLKKYFSNCF